MYDLKPFLQTFIEVNLAIMSFAVNFILKKILYLNSKKQKNKSIQLCIVCLVLLIFLNIISPLFLMLIKIENKIIYYIIILGCFILLTVETIVAAIALFYWLKSKKQ